MELTELENLTLSYFNIRKDGFIKNDIEKFISQGVTSPENFFAFLRDNIDILHDYMLSYGNRPESSQYPFRKLFTLPNVAYVVTKYILQDILDKMNQSA